MSSVSQWKLISIEVQNQSNDQSKEHALDQSDWGMSQFFQFGNSAISARNVVEFQSSAPQQPPVIGHCLTPQIEAKNKGCHLSVTRLLMTGGF